jgi:hypothetical protein
MTKRTFLQSIILLLSVAFLLSLHSLTRAEKADQEGPLGLTWGTTSDQVRALGAELKDMPKSDYGASFVATKLPRVLSDQEATIISFGYDDRLWRLVAISKAFPDDPTGTNLKVRYQELLAILAEKYGAPSSVHNLGDSIFQQSQYFLAGVKDGRTNWYTNFSTPSLSVQLNLSAEDSSTGRWRIIYEEKSLHKAFDVAKKAREKGAL